MTFPTKKQGRISNSCERPQVLRTATRCAACEGDDMTPTASQSEAVVPSHCTREAGAVDPDSAENEEAADDITLER